MSIGDRLRSERENLGLSQPKFAAIAGTTKQTLFSWESGKTAPDGFQLSALAAAGADVLYILTGISTKGQALMALNERAEATIPDGMTEFADIKAHLQREVAAMKTALSEPELSARKKALLKNYDRADDAGKKIIESTASFAAQSDKRKKA